MNHDNDNDDDYDPVAGSSSGGEDWKYVKRRLDYLKQIRKSNVSRWEVIRDLHDRLKALSAQGEFDIKTALAVELNLTEQHSDPVNDELGQLMSAARIEDNSDFNINMNNSDEHEVETELQMNAFSRELVDSYDDLRQAEALVDQRLRFESERQQILRDQIVRLKATKQELESTSLQTLVVGDKISDSSDGTPETTASVQNDIEVLKRHLDYVAAVIRDQHNSKDRNGGSDVDTSTVDETWSLQRLIVSMVDERVSKAADADPYFSIDRRLPANTATDDLIDRLERSNIVVRHKTYPSLVRLTDYES